jgi:predicted protein tyrosine phosphatase
MTINHYTDLYNAERLAHTYDAVISLGHFLKEEYRPGKKYLFLDFDDVDFNNLEHDPSLIDIAPNATHICSLVGFIRGLEKSEKLLVHCFAGYSRSPAAVIIARCERNGLTLHKAQQNISEFRVPDQLKPEPNDIMINQYLQLK